MQMREGFRALPRRDKMLLSCQLAVFRALTTAALIAWPKGPVWPERLPARMASCCRDSDSFSGPFLLDPGRGPGACVYLSACMQPVSRRIGLFVLVAWKSKANRLVKQLCKYPWLQQVDRIVARAGHSLNGMTRDFAGGSYFIIFHSRGRFY